MPGGKAEGNETITECASRELAEETGLVVDKENWKVLEEAVEWVVVAGTVFVLVPCVSTADLGATRDPELRGMRVVNLREALRTLPMLHHDRRVVERALESCAVP